MKNNASYVYSFCLVLSDFTALILAFISAYVLRFKIGPETIAAPVPARSYLLTVLSVLPVWLLVHAFIGLYNRSIYEKRFSELGRLFIGSFIGILVVIGYNFITDGSLLPGRLVPAYGLAIGFGLLLLFRTILRQLRTALFGYGVGINNVLLIGHNQQTKMLVELLADMRHTGYRILGVVGDGRHTIIGADQFSSFAEAARAIGDQLHSVIQTELYADPGKNNEILEFAQTRHVSYRFVPGNSELFVGNIDVELFRGLPMIAVHATALTGWGRIIKRLFDLVAGSLLLIVAAPIMLLVALAIKLSDGGPVFLRQVRLTRFNQKFRVFKFRSNNKTYNGLTPDEAFTKMKRPDLLQAFRENGNFLPDDPRNTRIGRFIRATSLDELPQLFNVLKGELSLVGPRALIPKDLAEYQKRHTILSVKSGITGLAQVSGRNNLPLEERRKLDIFYAQNWSFWLDITILLKTLRAVLAKEGPK